MTKIPDYVVEAAAKALHDRDQLASEEWEETKEDHKAWVMNEARAALTAAQQAELDHQSTQEALREKRTGLFAGKIHFSLPSAESPFPFPSGAKNDGEDAAYLVEKKDDQEPGRFPDSASPARMRRRIEEDREADRWLLDERVREVSRMTKPQLRALIFAHAARKGREWLLGGPEKWSKDELVRYVLTEVDA